MASIKQVMNNQIWEEFVNSFLFANYKNLEIWYAKRYVAENGVCFNYIRFPKPENGKLLTVGLVEDIVKSIECDDKLCKQFFGPAYKKGSAEIQNDVEDISIIWNKLTDQDIMDIYGELDEEDTRSPKILEDMYLWDVYEEEHSRPKKKEELTPAEIKRREIIDRILRLDAIRLKDPSLAPEKRTPENLEACYTKYNWEDSLAWKEVTDPKFSWKVARQKYNENTETFELYDPISLLWLNKHTGKWVKSLPKRKKLFGRY